MSSAWPGRVRTPRGPADEERQSAMREAGPPGRAGTCCGHTCRSAAARVPRAGPGVTPPAARSPPERGPAPGFGVAATCPRPRSRAGTRVKLRRRGDAESQQCFGKQISKTIGNKNTLPQAAAPLWRDQTVPVPQRTGRGKPSPAGTGRSAQRRREERAPAAAPGGQALRLRAAAVGRKPRSQFRHAARRACGSRTK